MPKFCELERNPNCEFRFCAFWLAVESEEDCDPPDPEPLAPFAPLAVGMVELGRIEEYDTKARLALWTSLLAPPPPRAPPPPAPPASAADEPLMAEAMR